MKSAIACLIVTTLLTVGCANKNDRVASSSGVTDVSPVPAYTPPAQPVVQQPVTYDSMPSAAGGNGSGTSLASGGGSYTVKKGDTLYSIARGRYGDGKQWQKITSANPGLRPESLKVGQTIMLP